MGTEYIVVAGVIVLLFGASQLPKLARSLGSAKNEFEKAQREGKGTETPDRDAPENRPPSGPPQP